MTISYDYPSKYPRPFDHQVRTVEFLLRNPRSFNLSDMGAGKTLSTLWAIDILLTHKKLSKVLIICPLTCLNAVWKEALDDHLPHLSYSVLYGSKSQRLEALQASASIYLINFDGVEVILPEIYKSKFDLIVIDELTAYKSPEAKRTKNMIKLAKTVKGLWGLTATPVTETPLASYSLTKIVDPKSKYLPSTFTKFKNLIMEEVRQWEWVPRPGYQQIVSAMLRPSIRFTTAECVDMPPIIYTFREVQPTTEQNSAYKAFKKAMVLQYEQGIIKAVNGAVKVSKLMQITAGGVRYSEDDGLPMPVDEIHLIPCDNKIKAIIELYEENGSKPCIISTVYRVTASVLTKVLTKAGYRVGAVNGDTKDKAAVIRDFVHGELDFLLLQPQSASHGLNLQNANLLIHFSPIMSNELYEQINARIARPGQQNKMVVAHLYCTPTELNYYRNLKEKKSVADLVMQEFKA
jgi:SNF2 family DNA or RNA helicase